MMYKDIITLHGFTITTNSIGQQKKVPTNKELPCNKRSAGQREFFQSAQVGLKAEYVFSVNLFDYEGEEELTFNGKKYTVYRTYERGEVIELHCHKKIGVN